uniref:Uncharacterized protein n=1 Tax=Anopheles atroparvus TaxID=41427 RepID=A0A182JIZ2_ANOAO
MIVCLHFTFTIGGPLGILFVLWHPIRPRFKYGGVKAAGSETYSDEGFHTKWKQIERWSKRGRASEREETGGFGSSPGPEDVVLCSAELLRAKRPILAPARWGGKAVSCQHMRHPETMVAAGGKEKEILFLPHSGRSASFQTHFHIICSVGCEIKKKKPGGFDLFRRGVASAKRMA